MRSGIEAISLLKSAGVAPVRLDGYLFTHYKETMDAYCKSLVVNSRTNAFQITQRYAFGTFCPGLCQPWPGAATLQWLDIYDGYAGGHPQVWFQGHSSQCGDVPTIAIGMVFRSSGRTRGILSGRCWHAVILTRCSRRSGWCAIRWK